MLLPHEQELIDAGLTTIEALVVHYRVLFLTCWELMTAEQQIEVDAVLVAAGLRPKE